MKVVYVAGPYRALTPWQVECNVREVERWGLEIAKLGAMPLMPHANTRFFNGLLTSEFWLEGTLELLKRCDAGFFIPGWRASSGSCTEWDWCDRSGKHRFEHLEDLLGWLDPRISGRSPTGM